MHKQEITIEEKKIATIQPSKVTANDVMI